MKKIISLILALAMIFSLCAINLTASAYDGPSVSVYIYNEQTSKYEAYGWDTNHPNSYSTVVPDGVTVTLSGSVANVTLENTKINGISISGCDTTNLTFKGTNNIATTYYEDAPNEYQTGEWRNGVKISGDANITFADGSVTNIGACDDRSDYKAYQIYSSAIGSTGNMTIVGSEGVKVNLIAANNGLCAYHYDYDNSEYVGKIDLSNFKGTMNIEDYGQVAYCSIRAGKDVIIDGGTYNLDSYCHYNIHSVDGNIEISNSTVTAKSGLVAIWSNKKVALSNSTVDLTATQFTIATNNLVIDDSDCNAKGGIFLGSNGDGRATLNMNSGTLVVTANEGYPAILGTETPADVNFNGGLTKLTASESAPTIALIVNGDNTNPSTINYSKVSLYEETDGQKVCTGEHEGVSIVALGYDGFKYGTRITNGAKVSTFAKPAYTAGEEQEVETGKDATFKINLTKEYLTGVYVDGKLVDSANYTAVEGSTILTLKASFLKTLEAGEHTLSVRYNVLGTDMKADTTFTITDTTPLDDGEDPAEDPATGDATVVAPFVVMAICSAAGAVVLKKKEF